jgi:hypothetical protein
MSWLRRIFTGDRPVVEEPKQDMLEVFLDSYNNGNKLYTLSKMEVMRGWPRNPSPEKLEALNERIESLKDKYSIKKGVCYERVKLSKKYLKEETEDLDEYGEELVLGWPNGDGEERKKVGTIQGAELMVSHRLGKPYNYFLVRFSRGTVTYRPGEEVEQPDGTVEYKPYDEVLKWFVPCPQKGGTRRKGHRKNRMTRKYYFSK